MKQISDVSTWTQTLVKHVTDSTLSNVCTEDNEDGHLVLLVTLCSECAESYRETVTATEARDTACAVFHVLSFQPNHTKKELHSETFVWLLYGKKACLWLTLKKHIINGT